MEAVRRLRDVMILSVFVLSIFALIGRQLYSGKLQNRCVLDLPELSLSNKTLKESTRQRLMNDTEGGFQYFTQ